MSQELILMKEDNFNYNYLKEEWNEPFIECENIFFFLMVSQSTINFASNKVIVLVIVLIYEA